MRAMGCSCLLAVAAAVLLAGVLVDLNAIVGEKDLAYNDEHCELVGNSTLSGGEDMALWRDGVAIVSAGDLGTLFSQGAQDARNTGVFAVDLKAGAGASGPPVRKLTLEGFPPGPALAGHGLYLSNRTGRLYVLNHGDYARNVSRVEIFAIEGEGYGDLRLRHVDRIESELFPLHCLNDVVEGLTQDQVFVSVWRSTVGVQEYKEGERLFEAVATLGYRYWSEDSGTLGILRCSRSAGAWSCGRSGAWGIPTANGMTVSPDRKTLLVSCPLCFEVWRYVLAPDGGLYGPKAKYVLPYPGDNVEWDEATGQVFIGMIPIPTRHRTSPLPMPMELMALPTASLGEDGVQTAAARSLLIHRGTLLSQSSAGLRFGKALLLGSPYHSGLLYCKKSGGLWAS
mmetsp:Transcript_4736/g.13842  ORF Transcript_4736/g.13842 Transcript_4736/m.13842 type:complete len:397 (-) Transcript_4736:78-1268(-)